MIVVITKLWVKPEMVRVFETSFKPMTEASRQEANCVSYHLYQDMQNENLWYTMGVWTSAEAIHEHMTSPHFKEAIERSAEMITREPEFSFCREVD